MGSCAGAQRIGSADEGPADSDARGCVSGDGWCTRTTPSSESAWEAACARMAFAPSLSSERECVEGSARYSSVNASTRGIDSGDTKSCATLMQERKLSTCTPSGKGEEGGGWASGRAQAVVGHVSVRQQKH
eukprot:scaffold253271_cov31-Tisochrysis_lutea.AAC.6